MNRRQFRSFASPLLLCSIFAACSFSPPRTPAMITVPVAAPSTPETVPNAARTLTNLRCTDNADFVADVTIPDGTKVAPNQNFDKIWRVRNTGTCTWGIGYELTLFSGQMVSVPSILIVPTTIPGATADLRSRITAPPRPGTFTSVWRLRNPSGAFFGVTLTVTIRVVE